MTPTNRTGGSGSSTHGGSTTLLVALSVYAVASAAILWQFEGIPTAVRVPIALPLLLFVPGYAILSALVPHGSGTQPEDGGGWGGSGISTLERIILAVVTSMALVPMVAAAVDAVMGVQIGPILATIAGVTLLGASIGIIRLRSESGRARGIDSGGFIDGTWRRTLSDPLTLVAVVVTVALLGSSVALVATGDHVDPLDTEFYVVDNGSESDATTPGAAYDLRVAQDDVANQRYTVVVTRGDGEAGTPGTELDRFSVDVSAGDTAQTTYRVPESELDAETTIRFLLYRGDAPESPDPSTAHRTLRQTVNTTG